MQNRTNNSCTRRDKGIRIGVRIGPPVLKKSRAP